MKNTNHNFTSLEEPYIPKQSHLLASCLFIALNGFSLWLLKGKIGLELTLLIFTLIALGMGAFIAIQASVVSAGSYTKRDARKIAIYSFAAFNAIFVALIHFNIINYTP